MNVTVSAWNDAWRAVGAARPDEAMFQRVIAAYSEPHRRYHTLQHLREVFEQLTWAFKDARAPAEICLALWFHDVVYDVHRQDNEAVSADMAHAAVLQAGLSAALADRLHGLVMATVHDASPGDHDTQLLVDIDLSILGSPPARFEESDAQIRREFAHVPREEYRQGRIRVLNGFLARERLYCTDRFHQLYEAQARENIARTLALLEAGQLPRD